MPNSFIIRDNICYNTAPDTIQTVPGSYAVCMDGVCQGVYTELPQAFKGLPIANYGDNLIIPGIVDLHIHAPQYAYRGLGMDLELMDWLQIHAFPEESKYDDLNYAAGRMGFLHPRLNKAPPPA